MKKQRGVSLIGEKLLFEPLHLGAHGGLRQTDARARAGKRAVLAHGDKSLEFAQHDRLIDFRDGEIKYISFFTIFNHG